MNILHSAQLMAAFFAGASAASANIGTGGAAIGFGIATLVAVIVCLIIHFNPVRG